MALTGPTLAPARGPATHLVVLVHGYGADGNDLIGLAPHWQGLLPTVAFAAPNAPLVICIVGNDPFGAALDRAVEGAGVLVHYQ